MLWTIPNILTVGRLIAAPSVGFVLILKPDYVGLTLALIIFTLAAITDYLDGYLARLLNQSTSFGRLLDPIADKAMVLIALCLLNYMISSSVDLILLGFPTIFIIFREIFVSGLREYLGDKSQIIIVTGLSKWKTALQMISIWFLLAADIPIFSMFPFYTIGLIILWFASIISIITALDYFRKALSGLKVD